MPAPRSPYRPRWMGPVLPKPVVGHLFEELVAAALKKIGLTACERFLPESHEDRVERIDLRITGPSGDAYEIQLTLRRDDKEKQAGFAAAALKNIARGKRVYVAVVSQKGSNLDTAALRTAHAIRSIVTRFQDFGEYDILGIEVSPTGGIRKFDPIHALHPPYRTHLLEERAIKIADRKAAEEAAARAAEEAAAPAAAADPIVPRKPCPMLWAILAHAALPPRHQHRIHPNHRDARVPHRPYFPLRAA